jgi:hypothetical protein
MIKILGIIGIVVLVFLLILVVTTMLGWNLYGKIVNFFDTLSDMISDSEIDD